MRLGVFLIILLCASSLLAVFGTAESGIFTLDYVAPSIVFLNPAGGESYSAGEEESIQWATEETHPGILSLSWRSSDDDSWHTVYHNIEDEGVLVWTIPADISNFASLYLTLRDAYGNQNAGISPHFSINLVESSPYSSTFVIDTIPPSVTVTSPAGGETWCVSDSVDIHWSATDSHFGSEPIQLHWRYDSLAWAEIVDYIANSGSFAWQIPEVPTESAMVRVSATDAYGNSNADTSPSFSIVFGTPSRPEDITIEMAGNDAILSWEPVTTTTSGAAMTPDGYIVLYSTDLEEDTFTILGTTPTASYTHQGTVLNDSSMYYQVIAWKGSPAMLASVTRRDQQEAKKESQHDPDAEKQVNVTRSALGGKKQ